jgi:hypothetical protein
MILRIRADIHFQVPLVSRPVQISDRLERVHLPRRLRAFTPLLSFSVELTGSAEKLKHEEERKPRWTRNSFKTQTTNTDCLPEQLTRQMTRRRTRSTSRWIRTWTRGGELEGVRVRSTSAFALCSSVHNTEKHGRRPSSPNIAQNGQSYNNSLLISSEVSLL